ISRLNPPAPPQTDQTPSDVACRPSDGITPSYISDPERCVKYTVCSDPYGMQMGCASGMHFSAKTSSCTYLILAGCLLIESLYTNRWYST
ncbi:hypothetical protein BIW11_08637, partial [Tropilaelaps mercedesae]